MQILDVRGKFRRDIRLGNVSEGAGLAVDRDKNIYATDPELNRLQVFDRDGKPLDQFGQAGTEPGQFNDMSGVWVGPSSSLFLVDTQNKRVQLFRLAGKNQNGACSL